MGFMAHSPPNYAAAKNSGIDYSGPARVVAIVSQPVFSQVNGRSDDLFTLDLSAFFTSTR